MPSVSDLRQALRLASGHRATTLASILVLSLGIGTATAAWMIGDRLLYSPPGIPEPERVFYLYNVNLSGTTSNQMSPQLLPTFRKAAADLAEFATRSDATLTLAIDPEAARLAAEVVSGNYFEVLGVRCPVGRCLTPRDAEPSNADLMAVISHELWRRRFAADPAVIGREIRIDNRIFQVAGVVERSFTGLAGPWTPVDLWVTDIQALGRERVALPVGRLKPGVQFQQVESLIRAISPRIRDEYWARHGPIPPQYRDWLRTSGFPVYRATDVRVAASPEGGVVPPLVVLGVAAMVAVVMMIAIANVAGLLLARGLARRQEIAIRRALGARTGQIVAQLYTEASLLAIASTALALWFAILLTRLFVATLPSPVAFTPSLDARAISFAVLVCVLTTVGVGLLPALRVSRGASDLGVRSGGAAGGRADTAARRWIVGLQLALSSVLLLLAVGALRDLQSIQTGDYGYQTRNRIVMRVGLSEPASTVAGRDAEWTSEKFSEWREQRVDRILSLQDAILRRLGTVHPLESFALTTSLPLVGAPPSLSRLQITALDAGGNGRSGRADAERVWISPGYFDVMAMRLLEGRPFEGRDGPDAPKVAIVSASLGRALWPQRSPIGRRLAIMWENPNQAIDWLDVVGVVNDTATILGEETERSTLYVPLSQQSLGPPRLLVAKARHSEALAWRDLKDAVLSADPQAQITTTILLDDLVANILYPRRVAGALLASTAALGLVLAAIGIFGMITYTAWARQRELGIRAALGAAPGTLVRLLVTEVALLTLGAAMLAFALQHLLVQFVPAIAPPPDPGTYLVAALILLAAIAPASLLPAVRASRINPVITLRRE